MLKAKRFNTVNVLIGMLIASFALIAAASLIASYAITYGGMRDLLASLYGAGRTARYFNIGLFQSTMRRIRGLSLICAFVAILLIMLWHRLERWLTPSITGLVLGFKHLRRTRVVWDTTTIVVLSFITAIAAWLRVAFVKQPIRYDEATTVLGYASKPIYLGLSLYNEPNNHLFHTLLVHLSIGIFGISEWSVRLPALLAGTILPLFTFILVRKFSGRMAAYLAASLVATSSVLVEFSTNARGYTILCVLTVALIICGLEASRRASPAWFALFSLCTVLGCWTVPLFVFPFVGTSLWLIWETAPRSARLQSFFRKRLFVSAVFSGVLSGVLYLPVIVANGPAALFQNKFVSPLRGQSVGGNGAAWRKFMLFVDGNASEIHRMWGIWNRDLPHWWPFVAIGAFAYALVICSRFRRLAIALAGWVTALFVARQLMLSPRNWLMFLPLFIAGVAIGLASLVETLIRSERARAYVGAAASVVLVVLLARTVLRSGTVLASTDTGVLFSAQDVSAFLESRGVSADNVICSYVSDIPLQYYWWLQTGKRQPNTITSASAVKNREVRDAWLVINKTYDESIGQDAQRFNIAAYDVLEERDFNDSVVYHINWENSRKQTPEQLSSARLSGDYPDSDRKSSR